MTRLIEWWVPNNHYEQAHTEREHVDLITEVSFDLLLLVMTLASESPDGVFDLRSLVALRSNIFCQQILNYLLILI